MPRPIPALGATLALLALTGCGSTPPPEPQKVRFPYVHSYEFMWEQARECLLAKWRIESENKALGTIVTEWDTQLGPMSSLGRRNRLRVELKEEPGKGFDVVATQDAEENTNVSDPLSPTEAEWSPIESTNGLAVQFVVDLDHRLNPSRPDREAGVR